VLSKLGDSHIAALCTRSKLFTFCAQCVYKLVSTLVIRRDFVQMKHVKCEVWRAGRCSINC